MSKLERGKEKPILVCMDSGIGYVSMMNFNKHIDDFIRTMGMEGNPTSTREALERPYEED
jgi:hypothetical protein